MIDSQPYGGKPIGTCPCGEPIFAYRGALRKYCSFECYNKYGHHNRGMKLKPVVVNVLTCSVCGKEINGDCYQLNNGMCFMCNWKNNHKLDKPQKRVEA